MLNARSNPNSTAAMAAPNTLPMPPSSAAITANSIISNGVLGTMAARVPNRYMAAAISTAAMTKVNA